MDKKTRGQLPGRELRLAAVCRGPGAGGRRPGLKMKHVSRYRPQLMALLWVRAFRHHTVTASLL
jgi:hypothetical protein